MMERKAKCAECKGFIQGKTVTYIGLSSAGSRSYCSSDCAIDAYERETERKKPRKTYSERENN